ncbi:hypothetical protein PFLmoz3_05772 [Pseudomonas fluorescens]|uniref:Uncharacterized protein n=1 Tax=Pseudomonas fluorescens TaxID=294 RepID=A0A120G5W2_PSEFL|nr:hypothetical protein PFLmoz3_05772 [Pseudomonas fluorescens]
MNGLGKQFLAGAAFAEDQGGGLAATGDTPQVQCVLYRPRGAQDGLEGIAGLGADNAPGNLADTAVFAHRHNHPTLLQWAYRNQAGELAAVVQVEGAIAVAHRLTQRVAQFTAAQALERTADQLTPYPEQLPRITVECLDAATLIEHHQAFVEHFEYGLLFFQQHLQRHLPRHRFGRRLNGAQGMKMKPAGLGGQGEHGQGLALGIFDRRGGAVHVALAQAAGEIFFSQHIHQAIFGQGQAGAVGALHRFEQATAHRGDVQPAKIQSRALGIREVDMPPRVVSQQSMHDLRGGGDQGAMVGQGRRQRMRRNKAVVAVTGLDTRLDTASPGIPDDLAYAVGTHDLASQALAPRLFQRGNGPVVQRGRPQVREVFEVLHTERLGHCGYPCSYFRHVSIDMSQT